MLYPYGCCYAYNRNLIFYGIWSTEFYSDFWNGMSGFLRFPDKFRDDAACSTYNMLLDRSYRWI